MPDMLQREELLTRFYQRDARNDGQFLVGVITTGIYCLPSCPAKKPLSRNVLFFEDEEGARQAGLRACKRCRPDHFYRRLDPDRECLVELVERVRVLVVLPTIVVVRPRDEAAHVGRQLQSRQWPRDVLVDLIEAHVIDHDLKQVPDLDRARRVAHAVRAEGIIDVGRELR